MKDGQFSEYAKIHINTAKEAFGVDLDFDEKSILKLDEIIEKAWSENPPIEIDNVVLLFGSFLGESIIKTLGGHWKEVDGDWGVEIGSATLMVFYKTRKRILNGMEDSISYYYKSTKGMISNDFKDIIK